MIPTARQKLDEVMAGFDPAVATEAEHEAMMGRLVERYGADGVLSICDELFAEVSPAMIDQILADGLEQFIADPGHRHSP